MPIHAGVVEVGVPNEVVTSAVESDSVGAALVLVGTARVVGVDGVEESSDEAASSEEVGSRLVAIEDAVLADWSVSVAVTTRLV